jgi:hypothetical protein
MDFGSEMRHDGAEGEDYTECSYWQLRRESPSVIGYKCGRCDTCCDEGDRLLQARKDGE